MKIVLKLNYLIYLILKMIKAYFLFLGFLQLTPPSNFKIASYELHYISIEQCCLREFLLSQSHLQVFFTSLVRNSLESRSRDLCQGAPDSSFPPLGLWFPWTWVFALVGRRRQSANSRSSFLPEPGHHSYQHRICSRGSFQSWLAKQVLFLSLKNPSSGMTS